MLEIVETVNEWKVANRSVALATVVETWGSSPRRPGAKLAVTENFSMIGSVSAGCVENAVIEEAVQVLQDHKPRLLHYGVSDDTAWEVGLTCGGKITIFVEPLDWEWWQVASQRAWQNIPTVTVTVIEGQLAGQKMVFDRQGQVHYATQGLSEEQRNLLCQAALRGFSAGEGQHLSLEGLQLMVDVQLRQPHLIIIGGVHTAIALQTLARLLGFRVTLVDPRKSFATTERFSAVDAIFHAYPDKVLPSLHLDQDSYVVVLTHDPKIDDPALKTALPSDVPYVGVLSSQRTHEKRVARLKEAGLSDELIGRIRTPIGLKIGAKTPEEIALSIMAEIIAVRNKALS